MKHNYNNNSLNYKELINEFFVFYKSPAFGSRSKSEIDLKVFEMMQKCGIVGNDYYEVARALKITPSRAKNLILNSELRLKSENDTYKELHNTFISKIKNSGYRTDTRDNKIIIFSLPDTLSREHFKYLLRKEDKTWDSSFNSEIVRIRVEDFLDIIADDNLKNEIKNKKRKDDIVNAITGFLKKNAIGLLGDIIKLAFT